MLRGSISFALVALAAFPLAVGAAVSCPDRTPASITAAPTGSLKCQDAIAKAGASFLKAQLKTLSACKLKGPAGACPNADTDLKIQTAAAKAVASIAGACGDDAAQAGLPSSYASGSDDAVVSSCVLSQHNVVGARISADTNGPTTEDWPGTGKERAACVKALSKLGTSFLVGAHKNATKCLAAEAKLGTAGNLSPICVGSYAGGSFVPPSDASAAAAQAKLVQKMEDSITKSCTGAEIATLFACAGAETVTDLKECVVCGGWAGLFAALAQEFAETGTFVPHGAGALQAAVSAAAPGTKLLIGSGDYQEEVTIITDNLSLVGCGGATDDRPRLIPPAVQVSGRGVQAAGVDGLLFQSLAVFNQANDGFRIAQANGVTFRDIVGDGNLTSRYAVFPVTSNNVTVELCQVTRMADAGIYVGQSSTIVVRHNTIGASVAGVEIENSGNAQVYANYSAGNTGGLLVFKDGSLPVQLSQCHSVHHNLLENNNTPNFGTGTVSAVPTGTGFLVVSNDTTPFAYNIARGNDTFGIALVDQVIASFGPPFSADESVDENYVFNNVFTGNGTNPDFTRSPVGADTVFLTTQASNNCQNGNTAGTDVGLAALPVCTLPPPAFGSCPAPSVP